MTHFRPSDQLKHLTSPTMDRMKRGREQLRCLVLPWFATCLGSCVYKIFYSTSISIGRNAKTEKRWNFVSHHFHIISAHMDLIEFIYGMAYEVFTHFLFTRSFHSCTQIMWILISIEWQTNNVFCHANKNIENVAFYLPHFAIRYSYPCSSQCIK